MIANFCEDNGLGHTGTESIELFEVLRSNRALGLGLVVLSRAGACHKTLIRDPETRQDLQIDLIPNQPDSPAPPAMI